MSDIQRRDPHFDPLLQKNQDRHKKSVHQHAAEDYAHRGLALAFQEQFKSQKTTQPNVSPEQLKEYHDAWQKYWTGYYSKYYADYYQKYHNQVREVVVGQHKVAREELARLKQDNTTLAEQKRRIEDPEAIRRDLVNRIVERGRQSTFWSKARHHIKGLSFAASLGALIFFLQFNPVVVGAIKQYLGPSSSASVPTIVEPSSNQNVNASPTLIIPKLNVEVPIVMDERSAENDPVQKALEKGVIRYWETSDPGQTGNVVILGHSSNNLLKPGDYKYVFVNLKTMEADDVIYVDFNGVRYAYKVTDKEIVSPQEFDHIYPTEVPSITLITCDPPGTDTNRLFVRAIQISPDPVKNNTRPETENIKPDVNKVPSAAPSIWDSVF